MATPTSPIVKWDRTDSGIWVPSGGTVDSHGQSSPLVGILMVNLDIPSIDNESIYMKAMHQVTFESMLKKL